jgi:hypothetical protein
MSVPCPWAEDGSPEMTGAELAHRRQIRDIAQAIWVAEGRPKGRDVEIWSEAEHELAAILSETSSEPKESRRAIYGLRWRVASVAAAVVLCLIFWVVAVFVLWMPFSS